MQFKESLGFLGALKGILWGLMGISESLEGISGAFHGVSGESQGYFRESHERLREVIRNFPGVFSRVSCTFETPLGKGCNSFETNLKHTTRHPAPYPQEHLEAHFSRFLGFQAISRVSNGFQRGSGDPEGLRAFREVFESF